MKVSALVTCALGALGGMYVCLGIPGEAWGQGLPEREFGEPWNGVGFGVRAIGMGGAYTAIAEDLAGIYWNPAGLIKMRDTQFGIMSGSPFGKRRIKGRDIVKTIPYAGGVGLVTTAFKPWVAGLAAVRPFHSESLMPWQENFYMGTFVMPLNKARTSALGINVKFLHSDLFYDPLLEHDFGGHHDGDYLPNHDGHLDDHVYDYLLHRNPAAQVNEVTGWAVDAGVIYNIPLPVKDRVREVSIGAMARNVVGRRRVLITETLMPAQALLGVAVSFDDLIPRERSVVALNLDQALRGTLVTGTKAQLRLGFEQWFFEHHSALRFGYATPFPDYAQVIIADPVNVAGVSVPGLATQGRPMYTLGMTIKLFKTHVDLGVTLPAELRVADTIAGLKETPIFKTTDVQLNPIWLPTDKPRFYVQLTYHWQVPVVSAYVKVTVEPLVFAPKRGEVAVFTLTAHYERGLEAWAVVIKNSARVPVRTFSGKGTPPQRLVWDGLDDRFNLAFDDDYTYTLWVRNRDGVETTTPPQSIRVFTPGEGPVGRGDLTLLYKILEETAKEEEATKAVVEPLIKGQLKTAKEPLSAEEFPLEGEEEIRPGPGGVVLPAPVGPSATVVEQKPAVKESAIAYRGVAPEQILRVQVPPAGEEGALITEYRTQQHIFKYLAREIKNVTLQSYAAVGPTVGSFMVQARYGNHLLIVETPMEVARGLIEGRLDEQQWLRAANVTLDGTPIQPVLR